MWKALAQVESPQQVPHLRGRLTPTLCSPPGAVPPGGRGANRTCLGAQPAPLLSSVTTESPGFSPAPSLVLSRPWGWDCSECLCEPREQCISLTLHALGKPGGWL